MREFRTMCKDTKTGLQMVLSEASYNMACDWLESKGYGEYDKFETVGNEIWITYGDKLFVYDEERGYLLTN